jgi:hypothetical protein
MEGGSVGKFKLSVYLFAIFVAAAFSVGGLWSWDKLSTYGKIITVSSAALAVYGLKGVISAVIQMKREGLIKKKTHAYNDGWPVMQPLGAKEVQLRDQNMTSGERVLGQVIGLRGHAVIATTQKVLVVKHGFMAGLAFDGKATSYDYRSVMGVEVRTGFSQNVFEVVVGGLAVPKGHRNKDKVEIMESPNAVFFRSTNKRLFQSMAAQIRLMVSQPPAASSNQAS